MCDQRSHVVQPKYKKKIFIVKNPADPYDCVSSSISLVKWQLI